MSWLLGVAPAAPLVLAALAHRERFWWAPAVGAAPALAAALLLPSGSELVLPWLLLDTRLGLGDSGRIFLVFSSTLWLIAGIHAAAETRRSDSGGRYRVLFLIAMTGNLLLVLSEDLVSFYTGFSVMGLAAYGLVIHGGGVRALQAGRVYLAMTVVAELALFTALVLIARQTESLSPSPDQLARLDDLALGLLIVGLGIKAGLVPLHFWLPLAYASAPSSAAAVLAGAMSKVALLGWLRYLPLGQVASPEWGSFLLLLGLVSLLVAVPAGLVQREQTTVLAYSSVAKAGLLVLTLGLVLMEPQLAPAGVVAVALFAAHHGLVKGALFLGTGLIRTGPGRALVYAGLTFLALAMAGAPLTSGSVAKYAIKPSMEAADWAWLGPLVAVSSVAMALLMIRFIWGLRAAAASAPPGPAPAAALRLASWLFLVALVAVFPFVLGLPDAWSGGWLTIVAALGLAAPFLLAAQLRPALLRPMMGRIPAGDLLWIGAPLVPAFRWLGAALMSRWLHLVGRLRVELREFMRRAVRPRPEPEQSLRAWSTAGTLWLALLTLLLLSLAAGDLGEGLGFRPPWG